MEKRLDSPRELRKVLNGWQIFFILLSVTIGTGVFSFNGAALNVTGPGGFILAMGLVGILAICFMDGLTEMIQVFPCTNSLIEYVYYFVDPDLAQCCGWAYWLAWSCFSSLQIISAADFTADWLKGKEELFEYLIRIVPFYIFAPAILYAINTCNVRLFGWIETIGGIIKLCFAVAVGLLLFYLGGKNEGIYLDSNCQPMPRPLPSPDDAYHIAFNDTTNLGAGFTTEPGIFPNAGINFLAALPIVTFSWMGIEIVAITAFEATSLRDLRLPAQRLPYVLFILFMVISIGSAMSIGYQNSFIPLYYGAQNETAQSASILCPNTPFTSTKVLVIVAALQVGNFGMADVLNGFMIFCALSAANTGLYTASRVLYGLTFKTQPRMPFFRSIFKWLGQVNKARVPRRALLVSVLLFAWYPFLVFIDTHYWNQTDIDDQKFAIVVPELLSTLGSTAIVFVWGAQCLAFIRYYNWFYMHKDGLIKKRYPELNRWQSDDEDEKTTILRRFQPGIAYVGLIGSALIVFLLPSAILWTGDLRNTLENSDTTGNPFSYEVIRLYLAQILLAIAWLCLKLAQWREHGDFRAIVWYNRLDTDVESLNKVIQRLQMLSEEPSKAPDRE